MKLTVFIEIKKMQIKKKLFDTMNEDDRDLGFRQGQVIGVLTMIIGLLREGCSRGYVTQGSLIPHTTP